MSSEHKDKYEFDYVYLDYVGGPRHDRDGTVVFKWSCKGIGFGELAFIQRPDDTVECDSETMSKEFVEAALKHFLTTVKFT